VVRTGRGIAERIDPLRLGIPGGRHLVQGARGLAGGGTHRHVGAYRSRPGDTVTELRLESGTQVLATRTVSAADGDTLAIAFQPPVEIAAGARSI